MQTYPRASNYPTAHAHGTQVRDPGIIYVDAIVPGWSSRTNRAYIDTKYQQSA